MKRCWDCLYFKTREYSRICKLVRLFKSLVRIKSELKKARMLRRPARYWRCSMGKTKAEVYVMETYARMLPACKSFEGGF
jgi:hypothetical protein